MKKASTGRVILGSLSILLAASVSFAASDVPLRNWSVPSSGALGKADHFTGPGAIFAPFQPCRLEDSRLSSGGQGPIVGVRTYDFVPGVITPSCGSELPPQVLALSLNFTVVNPSGPGFLYAYPQGSPPPPVSILNYSAGETKSNAAIVPVGNGGQIVVGAGVSSTDVIIDINGVFYNTLTGLHQLLITANRDNGPAIYSQNISPTAGSNGITGFAVGGGGAVHGVEGQVGPAAVSGSSGVHGINASTTGAGYGGFFTHAGSGYGVLGWALGTTGGPSRGVSGNSSSNADGSIGVYGQAIASTGRTFGVVGSTSSNALGSAGVHGTTQGGFLNAGASQDPAAVHGESYTHRGVLGLSIVDVAGQSVLGRNLGALGAIETEGGLGCTNLIAVCGTGNLSISGTKSFLEPHPADASKVIRYVALEGPEAGTYFRGRGRFQSGMAVIEVPESFRLVTDDEGLSVQITPIGEMATVAILRADLNRIVVRGSRNVEFYFTVNGVRRSFRDFEPIQRNEGEFLPDTPEGTMPTALAPEQKRRLIANGTFKEDGTVNKETARALGWAKRWEKPAAEAETSPTQGKQEQ